MNKAKQWFTGEVITAEELNRIEGRITDADGKMYRPNLLLNGDFRNVVNQRKQTIYTSTNSWNKTYTIDRWCIMSGLNVMSVNVNSDSITIATGNEVGHFRQLFEFSLHNDNYTITINVLNLSGSVTLHTDNSEKFVVQKGINVFKVKDLLTYVNILMGANSSVEIEYIKLEHGTIATPFVPRFFSEEVTLCQRYEFKNPNGGAWIGYGYVNSAGTVAIISIPLPVNMRDIPTISYSSFTLYGSGTSLDISNAHVGGLFNNILQLQINNVSSFGKNAVLSARIDNFEANAEIY